ncbi:MAG: hypothetical protein M3228_00025 [Actinomycetota bacterium]|nr:hypothetical protein [Actinomycetota bacterium]
MKPFHDVLGHRREKLLLAGDVLVHQRLAHPGSDGDVVHLGEVVTPAAELPQGHIEQLTPSGLR